jgi:hypothetical protein
MGAQSCLDGADKADGTLCGAGATCAADMLTPAQICVTGVCTTPTAQPCANHCNANNDGCADPPPPPPDPGSSTFAAPKKRPRGR